MASLTSAWYSNWQRQLAAASTTSLRNTKVLCAFNALVDKTVRYDARLFHFLCRELEQESRAVHKKSSAKLTRIDSPLLLLAALIQAFKTGKAIHLPTNQALVNWLENFPHAASIGGQAGIISNQLALIGAKPVLYTNQLSPQLAHIFSPRVKIPAGNGALSFHSIRDAADKKQKTRVNFVIEFSKGDALQFAGKIYVAPRSNRVILYSSSVPPLFDSRLTHHLPELGENIDAGIFSGYHALQPVYEDGTTFEYYLSLEELYLEMLKSHRNVPLHVEYVSTPNKEVDAVIYQHVAKHVDSFGLNEVEIVELAEKLKLKRFATNIVKNENAVSLHAAAEKIMEKLDLKRMHVHNLGYHLVLLKKRVDIQAQKKQVRALLFGSLVATSRALKGKEITRGEIQTALDTGVNEKVLNQMARLCSHFDLSRTRAEHAILTGVFDAGNHYLLCVPGQVVLPRQTKGLGDVLSSCSFLAGL
ncbi:hypothetical protein HY571_00585 [Candidatus Micrarchaeota archaeon]|nr:hypothetical protein [Candidatus Micrarchaeota archaeon]